MTSIWSPVPTLPLTSKPEAYVRSLNWQMRVELQRLRFEQRIQFELNQLRH